MNDIEQRVANLERVLGKGNFLTGTAQQNDATFNGRLKLANRTALPSTCATGELAILNGAEYICSAPNTWTAVGGSGGTPGGSDTQIQFNDGGSFGGNAQMTFDKTAGGGILLQASTGPSNGVGGNIDITAGDGGAGGGGAVNITGGLGSAGGSTGGGVAIVSGSAIAGNTSAADIQINSGSGSGSGSGGDVFVLGGDGGATGAGGDVQILAGAGQGGASNGEVIIRGGSFIFSNPTGSVVENRFFAIVTTTDATPTTIYTYLAGTSTPAMLEARVVAKETSGSGAATVDSAAYIRRGLFKRIGTGSATQIGSTQDGFTAEDQAGWDVTFATSGNNVLVQVTGAASHTIKWDMQLLEMFQFAT